MQCARHTLAAENANLVSAAAARLCARVLLHELLLHQLSLVQLLPLPPLHPLHPEAAAAAAAHHQTEHWSTAEAAEAVHFQAVAVVVARRREVEVVVEHSSRTNQCV